MEHSVSQVRYDLTARWAALTDGVLVRRMVEGAGVSLSLYEMAPGRRFELHHHPFAELGVVLAGRGSLLIEGGERPLREGDSFYIPSETPHGFVVPPGPSVLLLNVSVPLLPDVAHPPTSEMLRVAAAVVRKGQDPSDPAPRTPAGGRRGRTPPPRGATSRGT